VYIYIYITRGALYPSLHMNVKISKQMKRSSVTKMVWEGGGGGLGTRY